MRRRMLLAAVGTSAVAGCTSISDAEFRGVRVVNERDEEISVSVWIDRGNERLIDEDVSLPPADGERPSIGRVPLDESAESGLYTAHGGFDGRTVSVSNGPLDLIDCYFAEFRVTSGNGFVGQRVSDCDGFEAEP